LIGPALTNYLIFSGTLITEWDDGKAIWDKLTADPAMLRQTALLLIQIAEHYGFDGWLINVENSIQVTNCSSKFEKI
jgi:endo-beta-N-acetylglucosaminidase D